MDDASKLKAELKAYEKAFVVQHGRPPSKADIKADPEIALKYKSYSAKSKSIQVKAPPSAKDEGKPDLKEPDVFKTPTKSRPKPQYIAPSPSKLAALNASKSVLGSPAKPLPYRNNPFAAPSLTPRTKARQWLAGDVMTPPKNNWRQSIDPSNAVPVDAMDVDGPTFDPSPAKDKSFRPVFEEPMASTSQSVMEPVSVKQKSLKNSLLSFNMVKPGSTSFNAEKKRPNEVMQAEPSAAAVQPKAKKAKVVSNRMKGKNKAKAAAIDENEDQVMRAKPRLMDDGTMLMEMEALDGSVRHVKVGAYMPVRRIIDAINKKRPDRDQADAETAEADEEEDEDIFSDFDEGWATQFAGEPQAPSEEMAVEESVPDHLISLLSIKASPTRKHRQQITDRKSMLVQRLLQEPSLAASQKPKSGLADLDDDLPHGDADADAGQDQSGDDDWESEPEGWKDVAAGDDLLGLDD